MSDLIDVVAVGGEKTLGISRARDAAAASVGIRPPPGGPQAAGGCRNAAASFTAQAHGHLQRMRFFR